MTDDERQFMYELSLHGINNVTTNALQAMGDPPPKWRFIKRALYMARWDALYDLGLAAAIHEKEQHEAYLRQRR